MRDFSRDSVLKIVNLILSAQLADEAGIEPATSGSEPDGLPIILLAYRMPPHFKDKPEPWQQRSRRQRALPELVSITFVDRWHSGIPYGS